MSFRPCAVIPVYNHHQALPAVIEQLRAAGLYCLLIDDGSGAETRAALDALDNPAAGVEVQRLARNSGKGAAVLAGLRLAEHAGFTHAVQVDADGQHDLQRLEVLLEDARTHPDALISARPVYDRSVPKSRLYGRYATHVWVWVETLSRRIPDSMCGFRIYPLQSTLSVAAATRLGRRMDFDTEIMVRLYWAGTDCRFIPARVHYPEDGISHFRLLRDNLRISAMHTRLVFGMLPRIPALLRRRRRDRHWSRTRERGSRAGMQLVLTVYRLLGRRVCRSLLWPIAGYFYLANRKARAASEQFRARVRAANASCPQADIRPGWRTGIRHFHSFAAAALDKFIAWRDPQRIAVQFDRLPALRDSLNSGRGALLLGAHLGNLELARALSQELPGVTVNALVYSEHARKFQDVMEQANANYGLRLHHVQQIGPDTAMALRQRIDAGEVVVIVGDRTPVAEHSPVTHADFLGQPAPFAVGPYILAHILECPVYLFFCMAEDDGYRLYLEPFAERVRLPRRERETRVREFASHYAERLEAFALRYPLQWFNFYDFWNDRQSMPTEVIHREPSHDSAPS